MGACGQPAPQRRRGAGSSLALSGPSEEFGLECAVANRRAAEAVVRQPIVGCRSRRMDFASWGLRPCAGPGYPPARPVSQQALGKTECEARVAFNSTPVTVAAREGQLPPGAYPQGQG